MKQLDGSWRWLSAWGLVEFEGQGAERKPVAIAGASRDLTELKQAEELQRLLVNELNHRVKNTLATVQSIVIQTLRGRDGSRGGAQRRSTRASSRSPERTICSPTAVGRAPISPIWLRAPSRPSPRPDPHRRAFAGRVRRARRWRSRWRCTSSPPTRRSTARSRGPRAGSSCAGKCRTEMLDLSWRESGGPPVFSADSPRLRQPPDRTCKPRRERENPARLRAGGACLLDHRRA